MEIQPPSGDTVEKPNAGVLRRPMFIWAMPYTFLYFGLPVISKAFGASAAEIGALFTVFTATTLLLRPAAGWMLDRFGRKPFFVLALVIYALALALFAFAESMSWLYAARLVQGVGSAFLWSAVNTIVADLTPSGGRGRAMGQLSETTARGGMAGSLIALAPMFVFPEDAGWKIAFTVYAALTLYAALVAWKNVPASRPAPRPPKASAAVPRPLLKLLLMVFATGVPEAMLAPIYLIYLQDKFTTDVETIALAFFPAGLVTAFLATRLGALSDRFGRAPAMALGLAGTGAISLLMPRLPSLAWLAALYALSAVLWGLSEPAETAMVADLTGNDRLGMGYGLYDFVENLGFAVGPLLGGWVYDTAGMDAPFYLNGMILILAAGWVMLFLRRPEKQSIFR